MLPRLSTNGSTEIYSMFSSFCWKFQLNQSKAWCANRNCASSRCLLLFFVICFSIMHMNRKNPWESTSIEEHLLEIVQMRRLSLLKSNLSKTSKPFETTPSWHFSFGTMLRVLLRPTSDELCFIVLAALSTTFKHQPFSVNGRKMFCSFSLHSDELWIRSRCLLLFISSTQRDIEWYRKKTQNKKLTRVLYAVK